MSTEIKSPTFPESVIDGTIANWIKQEGDTVSQDEVIAEIETDKVVLEVVAPFDGELKKIVKNAGDTVTSAEVIAEFEREIHPQKMLMPQTKLPNLLKMKLMKIKVKHHFRKLQKKTFLKKL